MRIKNLLVQLLVLTPLSVIQLLLSAGIIFYPILGYNSIGSDPSDPMPINMLFIAPLICFGILMVVSIIVVSIKGHETSERVWDSEFVYRLDYNEHSNKWDATQIKGGWVLRRTPIVFLMIFLSPVWFFFQFISLLFAFIGLFSKHIVSYYGRVPLEECKLRFLQTILHFFFNIIIV